MGSTISWALTESPTLRDKTVEVLREAILAQYFKPGQKLVERSLAKETGVSRTSLREALSQLHAEGLVLRVPGKGMFVTQVTAEEARQIYEIRAVIESAMARLFAVRASEADIAALEAAVADAVAVNEPSSALLHAQKLDAVSDAIMSGSGNEVARQMIAGLRARVTYLRTITGRLASRERRQETMEMLHAIVDAYRKRDADLAERLTRAYVERSAEFARTVL